MIETSDDLHALALAVRSPLVETLKIALVDSRSRVIGSQILFVGNLNTSVAHPREIVAALDQMLAGHKGKVGGFFISHNHPSGIPTPSQADRDFTRLLSKTADLYGLPLLDHVITNGKEHFSFRAHGMIYNAIPLHPRAGSAKLAAKPDWQTAMLRPEKAEWEVVARDDLPRVGGDGQIASFADSIRTADPDADHAIYLSTQLQVLAVERLTGGVGTIDNLQKVLSGASREGAYAVIYNLRELDPRFNSPRLHFLI